MFPSEEAFLSVCSRFPLVAMVLGLLACGELMAQPTIPVRPAEQLPGRPKQMVVPTAPPPTGETAPVTVPAGPDPWYTLFGTGEVIGYIEPCG